MSKQKSVQTKLVHSDYRAPGGFSAFPLAIHHASTVIFDSVETMRSRKWHDKTGYTYGLHGTPTTFALEGRLAEIEGGRFCVLAPSGLAAIALLDFAILKSGDDVLIPDNAYGPNRDLGKWLARDFGVGARFYNPMAGAGIADLIRPNTKLIWTEAPGSVSMEVPDIPAICKVAHARGIVVALDNTWSAGLAFRAFAHGVDVVMQALTKYQSGGSDVSMGAVIVNSPEIHARLQTAHMRLGYGVSADDVYLISRGLQTLKLRFDAHGASAKRIAAWLKTRPEIAKVLHPAFPDCPGHEIWQRDFTGAGGLFSVIFDARYREEQTDRFVNSLEIFKIGFSWGGTHSLCVPYRMQGMRREWNERGSVLRLYIGLEDPQDLIADIEQAFAALGVLGA